MYGSGVGIGTTTTTIRRPQQAVGITLRGLQVAAIVSYGAVVGTTAALA
jgi:hypothetical protein